MYFDAAVVFVTNSSLFFRLAVAILCSRDELLNLLICRGYILAWPLRGMTTWMAVMACSV